MTGRRTSNRTPNSSSISSGTSRQMSPFGAKENPTPMKGAGFCDGRSSRVGTHHQTGSIVTFTGGSRARPS